MAVHLGEDQSLTLTCLAAFSVDAASSQLTWKEQQDIPDRPGDDVI